MVSGGNSFDTVKLTEVVGGARQGVLGVVVPVLRCGLTLDASEMRAMFWEVEE